MSFWSLLLVIHICSAIVGLLSGFLAVFLRKGSGLHGAAGTVFFVSMLSMTTTAAALAAFHKQNMLNVVVALLTFYMVITARRAARRKEGGTTLFDRVAFLFVLSVGLLGVGSGLQAASIPAGTKDGMPAPIYFVFGGIALLFSVSDLRMLARGGVTGPKRIARHLVRMSLALLIATISLYPGQARIFSRALRDTNLLMVPHILLLGSMIFWLYRMRSRRRAARETAVAAGGPAEVARAA